MTRLADFSGGLNKRQYPTRVPQNQGVEYRNIDNSGGILQSAKANKTLPDLNRAQTNTVSPEDTRFSFYPAGFFSNFPGATSSALYRPYLRFGSRKQYHIRVIEFQQRQDTANFYVVGNVRIPADENYQITLTTIESGTTAPSTIVIQTRDGTFSDPRDSSDNNINYMLTETQLSSFQNKAFSINVVPAVMAGNPIGLDSNEVLARLGGNTFFRQDKSSLVEYNEAAYFTRSDAKPLKIYRATRAPTDVSYSVNQAFRTEQVFITDRLAFTNQTLSLKSDNTLDQQVRGAAAIAGRYITSHRSKVSGSKIIHRTRLNRVVETESEARNGSYTTALRGSIDTLGFNSNLADYESITNYDFYLTKDKRLYLDNIIYIDLSSISGNSSNWLISVLDYPINFTPDPTKNNEQNLNASRENITQTRILLYKGDGTGNVISFTRDATTTNKLSFLRNGTPIENLPLDLEDLIGQHILKGVDSNDNLNSFSNKTPLFATVAAAGDMTLLRSDNVSSIQVNRRPNETSNLFYSIGLVRAGDVIPTGYNRYHTISTFTIDKMTGEVSKIADMLINCPIALDAIRVTLGYLGVDNGARITSPIDVPIEFEDRSNLSLTENLGIEPPPRGDEDNPLIVDGFTAFNPQNLTFPSNIDLSIESTYRSISTGGGESTRSARAYTRRVYENSITVPIRIIIKDKTDEEQKVVREYSVTLDDEAIFQTSKDNCRTKGGPFTRRVECTRSTTTNVRRGFTLDLDTYYSDNANSHDIEVAIGIPDAQGNTVYRQLPGVLSKANRSITTPDYIDYSNPVDVSESSSHDRTFNATIGADFINTAQAVTDSCRLRYCYTYYNANRDLESAPSKITDEIAVSRNDPVDIRGFVIPQDPQITDIRLYRICPDLGETAFTLIEQLPLIHIDGSALPEITAVDELTRADLGDLTYNDERQLVYREVRETTDAAGNTTRENIDTVIVNADGTRNENARGFDEQYNSYINANGRILDSWDNLPPPPTTENDENLLGHIKYMIAVRGALVAIIGQRIYWSQTGFPDYWPAQNFLDFSDEVTGIIEIANGLLVFTQNETHLISNFPDPANVSRTIISSEQGCVHIRTPQFIRGVPVWISNDGICTFIPGGLAGTSDSTRQNGRVEVISRGLLGDDYFRGNIITTEVHNDVYYILYDDRIVSMDQRYVTALQSGVEQIATNFVEYDTNRVRWIEKFDGEDVLYGTTEDNTVVELFGGTEELSMTYTSPLITMANDERIKRFDRLFVDYRQGGDLVLEIDFYSQSTTPTPHTYTLDSKLSVLQDRLPGDSFYAIQFKVRGKGHISAIAFTANPSKSVKPTGNNS